MVKFHYQVSGTFEITKEELLRLQALAVRHYDSYCKSTGRVGGFIYGWINRVDPDPKGEITVTSEQADVICKILEMNFEPDAYMLDLKWQTALKELIAESRRINGQA